MSRYFGKLILSDYAYALLAGLFLIYFKTTLSRKANVGFNSLHYTYCNAAWTIKEKRHEEEEQLYNLNQGIYIPMPSEDFKTLPQTHLQSNGNEQKSKSE